MPSSTALHTTLGSHAEIQFVMDFLCQNAPAAPQSPNEFGENQHRSRISFRWMNQLTHDKRAIIDTLGDHALLAELYDGLHHIRKQLDLLERCAA